VDEKQTRRLLDLLFFRFDAEGTSLFALLDAARDPDIYSALRYSSLEHECLFTGYLSDTLRAASPHLVRIVAGSTACQRLVERAWGQSWGLFLATRVGMREIRRHLRTLLEVRTEERKKLFFRYYDPRVLRVFLPTCDATQLRQVFGPIERFDIEAPDCTRLLRFRVIPEPSAPVRLRSWTYPLAEAEDAVDDRGQRA
jgi:hypothetical protein